MTTIQASLRALERMLRAPEIPADAKRGLVSYVELVDSWRRKVNLTGAKTVSQLVEVLIADALVLGTDPLAGTNPLIPHSATVIDVGAGAGAPTLPLLVLRPDVSATLVEPIGKRVAFLRTAIGQLGLEDRCRVEGRQMDERGAASFSRFDVALSRATWSPEEWRALGERLAHQVLVFTAGEPAARPIRTVTYRIPSGAPRQIAIYRCDTDGA